MGAVGRLGRAVTAQRSDFQGVQSLASVSITQLCEVTAGVGIDLDIVITKTAFLIGKSADDCVRLLAEQKSFVLAPFGLPDRARLSRPATPSLPARCLHHRRKCSPAPATGFCIGKEQTSVLPSYPSFLNLKVSSDLCSGLHKLRSCSARNTLL